MLLFTHCQQPTAPFPSCAPSSSIVLFSHLLRCICEFIMPRKQPSEIKYNLMQMS